MHGTLPQIREDVDARLSSLATTIKQAHAKSQQAAGRALEHAIAAGHALNQSKVQIKQVKSGRWLPWLRDHVGIPERTAQVYMRLARHSAEVMSKSATVADFGVREAAKMLARETARFDNSLGSVEWYTPQDTLDLVLQVLGGIDTDPCWHPKCLVRAATTYTKEQNGLAQFWHGLVFMNCPYHALDVWTAKLLNEYAAGRVTEAIALTTAGTHTQWWHRLRDQPRCFVRGRLRFATATGPGPEPAPFGSALFYLGKRPDRFASVFASVGDVFVRYDVAAKQTAIATNNKKKPAA